VGGLPGIFTDPWMVEIYGDISMIPYIDVGKSRQNIPGNHGMRHGFPVSGFAFVNGGEGFGAPDDPSSRR